MNIDAEKQDKNPIESMFIIGRELASKAEAAAKNHAKVLDRGLGEGECDQGSKG